MLIAGSLLGVIALFIPSQKITNFSQIGRSAIIGIFFHAVYLGGVFYAINQKFPVSVSALIVSLQPVLVAALSKPLLNHRIKARQWFGVALGFAGVLIALIPGLTATDKAKHFATSAIIAEVFALIGTTSATLMQKKYGAGIPMLSGTSMQYFGAAAVLLPLAFFTEDMTVQWTPQFIAAFTWLIGALSFGAVFIYFWLLTHNSAASVASLYYLVPPTALVMAYFFFDERLAPLSLAGFVVASLGVALVREPKK
jgi:drug/metabolite transporter (DMT)-like permease